MKRLFIISVLLLGLLFVPATAQQLLTLKRAQTQLNKGRWSKAEALLRKVVKKDSTNAAAAYLMGKYFFSSANAAFHVDSASAAVNNAWTYYRASEDRDRQAFRKIGADSIAIRTLRAMVDSAAFVRAKSVNTEASFNFFLENFSSATQREEAVFLRNEAAYQDAVRANTYQAFLSFLEKYPKSANAPEARSRYERLLYEARTSSRKLKAFEDFLAEYPSTPYRRDAEKHIFEIYTASGEPQDLKNYLKRYPRSWLAKRAKDILFHQCVELEDLAFMEEFMTDSARQIIALNKSYLVPVLVKGKFGFMNAAGSMVIKPSFLSIPESYLCGNIEEDLLVADGRLMARDTHVVLSDSIDYLEDIGHGFLQVDRRGCRQLIHKTGYAIGECIEGAHIVSERYVALMKNGKWGLFAMNGRGITSFEWDEFVSLGSVIGFKKNEQFRLAHVKAVKEAADGNDVKFFPGQFDEVKMIRRAIWIRRGELQGLLDQDLNIIIPIERHQIKQSWFGIVVEKNSETVLYEGLERFATAPVVQLSQPWVAVRRDSSWQLYQPGQRTFSQNKLFSRIRFSGPIAVGASGDSSFVHFATGVVIRLVGAADISFRPGKDSTAYLLVTLDGKKTIYNDRGKKLFTADADDVQYAGAGLFVVVRADKKGLVNSAGQRVLPIEYNAIGQVQDGVVSVLKNMKFGLFHVRDKKLIKPEYDKNVAVLGNALVAFDQGNYGFIGWDNKPVGKFEFSEVKAWNDSLALVRQKEKWSFYNLRTKKLSEDFFVLPEFIVDDASNRLMMAKGEEGYGIFSSKTGTVIPFSYSLVKNLGTVEEPVYFTEKHVPDASIFIVIYYNRFGQLLYRQVYEEEEYDKIFCAEN